MSHYTPGPTGNIKGVAQTIMFKMVDETDFASPETGKTPACTVSLDGSAFNACTNTPGTEISNGWYKILLTAAEKNADEIILRSTATGCAQSDRIIITS